MGPVRAEVMWQAVRDALEAVASEGDRRLRVLDVGGGTGGDAVRLAAEGHEVIVIDPSPDALAALARRADDAGVSLTQVLGDTGDLADHVDEGTIDLVLCHGVVEHVDDPVLALQQVARTLAPSGRLSIVVPGRVSAAIGRAIAGDFAGAQALVERPVAHWVPDEHGPRRYFSEELDALLAAAGFRPAATRGLRVFADLVPSAVVDVEPGAREALFAVESAARERHEFAACSGGLQQIACLELS